MLILEKDIRHFVDVASSTLGEDALAAQKTRYLLNALLGYSPLLYEFDPKKADYHSFMDLCKRVWDALKLYPALEDHLVCITSQVGCLWLFVLNVKPENWRIIR